MNRYKAIIVDDEKDKRDALEFLLAANCPEIHLYGTAESASQGRELLKKEAIDFIFLDISMPDEDGFAFLRSIPKENYGVIFVTAHEEFALNALKANAIDYLLKPLNPQELREAVAKAIHYLELRKNKPNIQSIYHESLDNLNNHVHSENKQIKKITIVEQFGFQMVNVSELMYLQAENNYTTLHLSGKDKILATRLLGEFEKMLENPMFYRIHKSTIINLNYLKAYSSYEGNYAVMADGAKLNISRRKLIDFREAVMHFSKTME
jgi:two-component system LytT family response regulator